ncbi:type I-U CRISPR-associated protein Csb2 [Saccharopolyspora shandongensis]|uniref:type I-G CRISPR-associated protein Csb2 n=1 Tax=Saccharopolyspora shandongensis TaxID=418495 RepID=UPI003416F7B7
MTGSLKAETDRLSARYGRQSRGQATYERGAPVTAKTETRSSIEELTERLLPFAFPRGIRVDARQTGVVTSCLRKAVMQRASDPLPPEISGHGADDLPHIAYLPLIDAGHPDARGDVTGIAILVPTGRPDLASAISTALTSGRPFHLEFAGARLRMRPGDPEAVAARWTGPARTWATITPVVLDRFPGPGREAAEITRTCTRVGLPTPTAVTTHRNPLIPGGADLARNELARREKTLRPYTHAKLEFREPLRGPMLLGAQRYLGMGMLLPITG